MLPNVSPHITKALLKARTELIPVSRLIKNAELKTEEEGYAVQAALHEEFRRLGQGELAGWKIGATTSSMQTYLGVDGPAYGRVMSANCYDSDGSLSGAKFFKPGIECEIGVRIGNAPHEKKCTREDVTELIGAVFPAIEIVENRYGDFQKRGTPLLIADDFFHKAAVLGKEISDWNGIDLSLVKGQTWIDGQIEGSGTGVEVMGHPLEAVAWLANALLDHGFQLSEGQIILTGSVTPVMWLEDFPCSVKINCSSLGTVSVYFTD